MVYTKTGDKGTTSLVDGRRVLKCDDRVEAYGTVDELNSYVGLVAEYAESISPKHYAELKQIQNELFTIQTLLATESLEMRSKLPQLSADAVTVLEKSIDEMTAELPQNKAFIIPGGSVASTHCHVARTICRRAERCCVRLAQEQPVEAELLMFVNRLSDYLFVLSRLLLKKENKAEHYWQSPKK